MSRIHNSVNIWFLFNIFLFFLAFSFYFLFSMNEIFMKCSRCLPQKKTSRYTIVWFVWGVHYYFPRILVWCFFSFVFSFFLLLFIFHEWNFHEMFKMSSTEKNNIKVHNSVVCLRVHYCFQLLSWGHVFFFPSFPLPFPLLYFSFNYLITFLVSFIWNYLEIPRNVQFPKIYDALLKPN